VIRGRCCCGGMFRACSNFSGGVEPLTLHSRRLVPHMPLTQRRMPHGPAKRSSRALVIVSSYRQVRDTDTRQLKRTASLYHHHHHQQPPPDSPTTSYAGYSRGNNTIASFTPLDSVLNRLHHRPHHPPLPDTAADSLIRLRSKSRIITHIPVGNSSTRH
jgi:hypothetical protein